MQGDSLKIPGHWWGKIIGGLLGLFKGGPTGALVGALIGHFIDRFILGLRQQSRIRGVFFRSLFGALGCISKADGRVSEVEIAAAENLMRRLDLKPDERQEAISAFNEGKRPLFGLEASLREFVHLTALRHDLRQMFLEILIEGAAADARVSQAEEAVLFRVSRALSIPAQLLDAMLNASRAARGQGPYQPGAGRAGDLSRAYATLGLKEKATDAEIKRAYRKLISQYHPDRLVSQGLPEEMMEKAKVRVREINAAYDALKSARGIK